MESTSVWRIVLIFLVLVTSNWVSMKNIIPQTIACTTKHDDHKQKLYEGIENIKTENILKK